MLKVQVLPFSGCFLPPDDPILFCTFYPFSDILSLQISCNSAEITVGCRQSQWRSRPWSPAVTNSLSSDRERGSFASTPILSWLFWAELRMSVGQICEENKLLGAYWHQTAAGSLSEVNGGHSMKCIHHMSQSCITQWRLVEAPPALIGSKRCEQSGKKCATFFGLKFFKCKWSKMCFLFFTTWWL